MNSQLKMELRMNLHGSHIICMVVARHSHVCSLQRSGENSIEEVWLISGPRGRSD